MSIHSLPRGAARMPARAIAGTRLASAGSRPCKSGLDAELVIYRMEEAGSTLLALPATGYSPRLKQSRLEIVRTALEAYGWEPARAWAPMPTPERVTRMDEALGWIPLIPRDRYVLRRIVGARSLVSPLTERHLFSWRRLGTLIGADHKAIQRWHAEGIGLIVAFLNRSAVAGPGALRPPAG